ncbi:hypothetical protein Pan216_05760 [Planctomycetes bacterium Pan216]|uniref:Uncharacterized protein n=2 Tax=Kolteria novifilia TaxID=2527975 RepID=A0A518AYE9_9BACT|nr:hypothetical protein Pan216_05760 [Planctomycetes bacterium Pan216]
MIYWVREIAGWLLVLMGLYLFLVCLNLIGERQVVGASIIAGIGIFVFRGGIHLVKVAAASRVVIHAAKQGTAKSSRETPDQRPRSRG